MLTGAVYDNDAKLLRITPDQLKNLQTLIFFIGGVCINYFSPFLMGINLHGISSSFFNTTDLIRIDPGCSNSVS